MQQHPHTDPLGRPALSLVIPAYNEQARLPYTLGEIAAFQAAEGLDLELIVVDNGSADATSAVAQQLGPRFPCFRLLRTDRRGKGLAVRTGMLAARGPIVLFADADLSWSLEDLRRFPAHVSDTTPVVIGSREGTGSRRVGEPEYRHVMGRIFNRLVQRLAVPGIEDTQCGIKAFRGDAARAIFARQTIEGFGFDVEVLFLARMLGYGILPLPVRWEHKQNSRVQPLSDTLRMVLDVLAVRRNALAGRYRHPRVAA